jgi:pyruvate formate lyase activating enzyme
MKKGRIFDISRGCVDDGPGLRTVVFLKGCLLRCPWCHNPEGKSFEPAIAYDLKKCIGCKECKRVCPREWDFGIPYSWRNGCRACGLCADVCPSKARRLVGKDVDAESLVQEIMKDEDFFRGTGGGVTFSGGEPFLQADFLNECLILLKKRNVHTAVETAGFFDEGKISIAENFDLVLFDLKHVDSEKFKKVIGKDNSIILKNLSTLSSKDIPLEIRITVVPEFNDTEEDILLIASYLKNLKRPLPVRLLPFHRLARAKEEIFGVSYPYSNYQPVSNEKISLLSNILGEEGVLTL